MKKAILLASIVLALFVGAARSEACHTHGYVRASTLNDLFSTLPPGSANLTFGAGGLGGQEGLGNGLGNVNLNTTTWGNGNGDNHQFSWSATGDDGINFGEGVAAADGSNDPYQQLEAVIGDIELALDAQYDKDYAD